MGERGGDKFSKNFIFIYLSQWFDFSKVDYFIGFYGPKYGKNIIYIHCCVKIC